jgi:hypothetical protein
MNDTQAKAIASAIVWTAFTIVAGGTLASSDNLSGGVVVVIMVLLVIAAGVSMGFIWMGDKENNTESAEKAKRQSKLDRVLEKLSDQDVEELRTRLMAESDGEEVSLNELLRR